jgi:ubiquitin-protein ligase E3 A
LSSFRYFWEVLRELSPEQKKKFLAFTTGSDRLPVKGVGNLSLIITKGGGDSSRFNQISHLFIFCLFWSKIWIEI